MHNIIQRLFCLTAVSLLSLWHPGQARVAVVITEVLKNPAGPETAPDAGLSHEFIEILNIGTDTLTLDSLFLTDGEVVDSVVPWRTPLQQHPAGCVNRRAVPPGRFALILDRDYSTTAHPFTIADSAIILTVPKAALCNGLTDDDGFLLYKGTAAAITDSLAALRNPGFEVSPGQKWKHTTPAGTPEGFALVPASIIFTNETWRASPDSLSPGRYEFFTGSWLIENRFAPLQNTGVVACSLAIFCAGPAPIAPASWTIKKRETGAVMAGGSLTPGANPARIGVTLPLDTVTYTFALSAGTQTVTRDLDISAIIAPASPLRINEIFPRATAAIPEWIELINVSSMVINCKNWQIGNSDGFDTIISSDLLLQPRGFCIITSNRQLFSAEYVAACPVIQPARWQSLDNYRDTLHLWKPGEALPSETVFYDYVWFSSWQNQSLERVSQTMPNATTSNAWALAGYSSPGQPNATATWRGVSAPTLHIGPLPFTPDGDGRDDCLAIALTLPASATATITIYGFDGSKIIDLEPAPKLLWDGNTKSGTPAPVGPIFVVAAIQQYGKTTTLRQKGILWR
jgi:hypothetical protein